MEVLENSGVKHTWIASEDEPVYLFYCKANIQNRQTVVIMQHNEKYYCSGVSFKGLCGTFEHQNSVGKARSSGSRNTLKITSGEVILKC